MGAGSARGRAEAHPYKDGAGISCAIVEERKAKSRSLRRVTARAVARGGMTNFLFVIQDGAQPSFGFAQGRRDDKFFVCVIVPLTKNSLRKNATRAVISSEARNPSSEKP